MINFAHGDIFMIGAFIALIVFLILVSAFYAVPVAIALLIMMVVAMLLTSLYNWVIEKIAYRPLRGSFRLAPLITAIGMSIVLQNVAMIVWGRNYMTFPPLLPKVNFEFAGANFTAVQVMIVVVSGLTMSGLVFLVYRTKLGMAMRATAQNPQVANLMGVNSNRVISAAFVIGSSLGALAGVMVGTYYEIAHYQMGFMLGLKAFTAAVLGGIGNLNGAVLGGFVIGFIQQLNEAFLLGNAWSQTVVFAILIMVMVFKPEGILGKPTTEKV